MCEGYNGYWLIDDAPKGAAVLTIASEFSGVKAELRTDQPGVVLYSCSWMDGSAILKSTQGLNDKQRVVKSSCVAIEAQDYPDGINRYVLLSSSFYFLGGIIELTISTVPSGVALMLSSLGLARSTAGRARGPLVFSKHPAVRMWELVRGLRDGMEEWQDWTFKMGVQSFQCQIYSQSINDLSGYHILPGLVRFC